MAYRTGHLQGHAAVWLENDRLQVSILPERGAELYEFIYRPLGVDCLYKTRPGLPAPDANRLPDIIADYAGGWQELFPNTGDACRYRGLALPTHGEVAVLPWQWSVVRDDELETCLRFWVETPLTSFRLQRDMRVRRGAATLELVGTVTNIGEHPADFVWGHHIVLGGDFLERDCQYLAAARTLVVPAEPKAPARARLAAGQRSVWPLAQPKHAGAPLDLRAIPGPEVRSHDEVYLTDLDRGTASVYNPRLDLRFEAHWDAAIFGCLVMWQPFNGLDMLPWVDSYGVGLEPWTTGSNLAGALAGGTALTLTPGATLTTRLDVGLYAGIDNQL